MKCSFEMAVYMVCSAGVAIGFVNCSGEKTSKPVDKPAQPAQSTPEVSSTPATDGRSKNYKGETAEWWIPGQSEIEHGYFCNASLHSPTELRLRTYSVLLDNRTNVTTTTNLVSVTSAVADVQGIGTRLTAEQDPSQGWLSIKLPSPVSAPMVTTVSLNIKGYESQTQAFPLLYVGEVHDDISSVPLEKK